MSYSISYSLAFAAASVMTLSACGGGESSTATATTTTATGTSSSTTGVLCSYSTSVPYSGADSATTILTTNATATWSCSSTLRSITANGLPDHTIGSFPNQSNPNYITAQAISASVKLAPTKTSVITARTAPIDKPGIALNGIVFDPGTAGTCDNTGAVCDLGQGTGAWKIEALGQSSFRFGTDSSNAHVQPQGTYHYHGIPEGFVTKLNKGNAMSLIGWAPSRRTMNTWRAWAIWTSAMAAPA